MEMTLHQVRAFLDAEAHARREELREALFVARAAQAREKGFREAEKLLSATTRR